MTDDDLKRSGRSDVNPKIHTDKKDAEKQTEKIRGGMKQDKQLGEYGGVSDEKQKILEEVKLYCKQNKISFVLQVKSPINSVITPEKLLDDLLSLAFAKGEETERKKKYLEEGGRIDISAETFKEALKQSEQRGYEHGYKNGKAEYETKMYAHDKCPYCHSNYNIKEAEQRGYEKGCKDTEKRMRDKIEKINKDRFTCDACKQEAPDFEKPEKYHFGCLMQIKEQTRRDVAKKIFNELENSIFRTGDDTLVGNTPACYLWCLDLDIEELKKKYLGTLNPKDSTVEKPEGFSDTSETKPTTKKEVEK